MGMVFIRLCAGDSPAQWSEFILTRKKEHQILKRAFWGSGLSENRTCPATLMREEAGYENRDLRTRRILTLDDAGGAGSGARIPPAWKPHRTMAEHQAAVLDFMQKFLCGLCRRRGGEFGARCCSRKKMLCSVSWRCTGLPQAAHAQKLRLYAETDGERVKREITVTTHREKATWQRYRCPGRSIGI